MGHFYPTDYESVVSNFNANFIYLSENHTGQLTCEDIPDPECPVGWSVVEAAMSGIKHLWGTQQLANMNSLQWSQIRTPKINSLISLVKGRQRRMRKRNSAEKIDKTTNAFLNVKRIPGPTLTPVFSRLSVA